MDLPTIIYFTVFHTIGDLNSIRNESIKMNSFVQIRGSKIPFSLFLSWHLMLLEKRYIKNSRFWFVPPFLGHFSSPFRIPHAYGHWENRGREMRSVNDVARQSRNREHNSREFSFDNWCLNSFLQHVRRKGGG